ncbi:MAG: hypothetical protein C0601_10635 [Candidatus Muiribacterium halophilum]|uniref:GrpB family protein n=1 Tax=Muiribacterium halophilum TaxID=2053465 RepID=A0A2N5ZC56_MUIH1|nr:MAG: hypothetical protein C0601_10635 [Candidatus Muirbacterium halophilum]
MSDVIVVDHDPDWEKYFIYLCLFIRQNKILKGARIEHVGSTSVPGLAAKPVIDMDIVAISKEKVNEYIKALSELGYEHRGDLGITGRDAFRYQGDLKLPRHNLYVVLEDSIAFKNHIILRDTLRFDDNLRERYADLKKRLAKKFPDNVDKYCEAKSELILEIISTGELESQELEQIRKENKL